MFSKLCILKGIYPREPPKKFAGNTSTYYLAKDLRFMMHDPLVEKFRDHRAWRHKVKKAQKRKLKDKVERLMKNEPKYTLTHLVKERYPTFMDAIRDLDDAITMIHLFMLMPTKTIKASTFYLFICTSALLHLFLLIFKLFQFHPFFFQFHPNFKSNLLTKDLAPPLMHSRATRKLPKIGFGIPILYRSQSCSSKGLHLDQRYLLPS